MKTAFSDVSFTSVYYGILCLSFIHTKPLWIIVLGDILTLFCIQSLWDFLVHSYTQNFHTTLYFKEQFFSCFDSVMLLNC